MKNLKLDIPKIIAYILVPIFTLAIILNISAIIICDENPTDFKDGYSGYENTNKFANECFSKIIRAIDIIDSERKIIEKEYDEALGISIAGQKVNYKLEKESDNIQYNFYTISRYDVLVVMPSDIYVTNVEKTLDTDTKEEIKNYILSKKYFWSYDGETVKTSIGKLSYENLIYHGLEEIQDRGYKIYIALQDEKDVRFNTYMIAYDFASTRYERAPYVVAICSILLIAVCLYIIKTIGHKKGEQGIFTNELDKIPYEVIETVAFLLLLFELFLLEIFVKELRDMSQMMVSTAIMASIFIGLTIYATLVTTIVTTIRRIKAHTFWKNTIVYKLFKFAFNGVFDNLSQTIKIAVLYGGFIAISGIASLIILNDRNILLALVLLVFWYYVFKKILDYINRLGKIREKIGNMYNGNIEYTLDENELNGELKQVAKELNDISGGLSNAIEEATKSERLKTELITNVSHDIKTPLTSIINYVDLMKQEKIENKKVKEYLDVLDNKSQRLKKLTEDLIEASKVSSGNIKLTMENLNVKELIKQVGGEFEDRFKSKGLQVIESFPEEEINILADGRYMYRVMENMYVNVAKYALEDSRVYVDVNRTNKKVQIAIKNISKDKLNISVDELMERFTRGDVSRTTEGSGLGISIAKSLTELQNGKFEIYLDGDLFKVVIEFEIIEEG